MFDHFISDTHFGHRAIIDLCHRPFNDVEEMNETIIRNYNSVVKDNDKVLWIGDVSFLNKEKTTKILSRMHGEKWLVSGNHDKNDSWMIDAGFSYVVDSITWFDLGIKYRASHYPYRDNMKDRRFEHLHPVKGGEDILLHGHTHSLVKHSGKRMIHCGVDAWEFKPATWHDIRKLYRQEYGEHNG